MCGGETHDDRHSVCALFDEALKGRVLRESFNLFHPGAVNERTGDVTHNSSSVQLPVDIQAAGKATSNTSD